MSLQAPCVIASGAKQSLLGDRTCPNRDRRGTPCLAMTDSIVMVIKPYGLFGEERIERI
jgi:hypothetical protein